MQTNELIDRLRLKSGSRNFLVTEATALEAADRLSEQRHLINELVESLQWMVDNDDTNEGDEPLVNQNGQSWNEINSYWIEGLNRARSVISRARDNS